MEVKKQTVDISEEILSEISQKYPTLNFELATPDYYFTDEWINNHQIAHGSTVPVQNITTSEKYEDVKASFVADLDLKHIKVGTTVTLGKMSMTLKVDPISEQKTADFHFSYKF